MSREFRSGDRVKAVKTGKVGCVIKRMEELHTKTMKPKCARER